MSNRRPRSDSILQQKQAFSKAAESVAPPETVRLRKGDRPFFDQIVAARARGGWDEPELHLVANLARCLADIERISSELAEEGDTMCTKRGTPVVNPKHFLLETLSRRAVALTRLLQIDAASRFGRKEQVFKKEEAARKIREVVESLEEDDLIPGPAVRSLQ